MSILTVGPGEQYSTIHDAVNVANSGDTINVDAGTYDNDFTFIGTSLTLQAVNGRVLMTADQSPPDGKAIITEGILGSSINVVINGFDISGATVGDNNGAAIRYEGGNLILNDAYFHDNQEGLLAAPDPTGTITINHSEFAFNGDGSGSTHNLYVNDLASLTITDSYFHDADIGHEIKSRAQSTTITNTRIFDNNGTASYSIDLPFGGNANISNNIIEQGPNSDNNYIIAYGEEGAVNPGTNVTISNNIIVNDQPDGKGVLNAGQSLSFTNNSVYGLTSSSIGGPLDESGTTFLITRPALDTSPIQFLNNPAPPPTNPPPAPTDFVLTGDNARNTLIGGDGNDTLDGGLGRDTYTTGNGHDLIVLDTPLVKSNIDNITDFDPLNDTIGLSHLIFGAAGPIGDLSPDAFSIGGKAHDASDRILYNSSNGVLSYDPDGTGLGSSSRKFAILSPGLNLTSLDFKII